MDELDQAILGAVEAIDLLAGDEDAEAELVRLLRETGNKPNQREILLRALRCCVRLDVAEPFLRIEAEAREYAEGVKQRAEATGRKNASWIIERAQFQAGNILGDATERCRRLAEREADVERRRQEMMSPHAPALALLQSVLDQYPLGSSDRLPPTAFLSACALVASLMGTNPVDLSLKLSDQNIEFGKRK